MLGTALFGEVEERGANPATLTARRDCDVFDEQAGLMQFDDNDTNHAIFLGHPDVTTLDHLAIVVQHGRRWLTHSGEIEAIGRLNKVRYHAAVHRSGETNDHGAVFGPILLRSHDCGGCIAM